jgi:hypothetical protein
MTITKSIAGIAAFVAMTWGGASIVAQAQTVGRNASGVDSYQFEIAATTQWIETKIDLRAHEKLRFTSTGASLFSCSGAARPPTISFTI